MNINVAGRIYSSAGRYCIYLATKQAVASSEVGRPSPSPALGFALLGVHDRALASAAHPVHLSAAGQQQCLLLAALELGNLLPFLLQCSNHHFRSVHPQPPQKNPTTPSMQS
ncbi:hypothetical protein V2G26_006619 [Clonostachys chloroleuca]